MVSLLGGVLLVFALSTPSKAFFSFKEGVANHVDITKKAILQKVTETCRDKAEDAGEDFNPTGTSPEELIKACLGSKVSTQVSGDRFHSALQEIYQLNTLVDRDFMISAPHHFNSEAFIEGRYLITEGMATIKANIRKENFKAARETLGRVLHTLQDFYSHSNWVELGNTEPYFDLLRSYLPMENLADKNTATCNVCASGTCSSQILPNILKEKKLTSGFMESFPGGIPKGKCSHGGTGDHTTPAASQHGISKDERRPDNMKFHDAAVKAATDASLELLEDIRIAAGDDDFLRLMGIGRASALCFVIDTTGSMSTEIVEAISVSKKLIDERKGTQEEPSEYILVPFNDPAFGPLIRTADSEKMKEEISKLTAKDGGDEPEMCFSGLQMALANAPSSSQIYVFTDAGAKDIALKDTILALIDQTESTVNFYRTFAASGRRRRSTSSNFFELYQELALASGGLAIQVQKSELHKATDIIRDTTTSALVTVLQRARNPGKDETFSLTLDESLTNITIYITGTSIVFTLTDPAGVSQSNDEASGKLGMIRIVGNLWRIRLNENSQTGNWKISIKSSQPYTLKVTGQSTITFIYDFVERFGGPHPGYATVSGRPQAGQPAILMVTVIGRKGPSSVAVNDVGLVLVSGQEAVTKGEITDMGNGNILVKVDKVPVGEFVVLFTGTDKLSNSEFQRQSTTQMSVSKVSIKAVVGSSLVPGEAFKIPFSILTQDAGGAYTITASNDRAFPMAFKNSITLTTGQYTDETLTITPPSNTESGTDATLTIEAKSSSGADSNYIVLRLSVVTKITDFTQPQCEVNSVVAADCPPNLSMCKNFYWQLSANLTDGNGTGIERISLFRGNGTLTHTSLTDTIIQANYNSSCCSQIAELVAVDKVGNVGKCSHSIVRSGSPPAVTMSLPLWLALLVSVFMAKP